MKGYSNRNKWKRIFIDFFKNYLDGKNFWKVKYRTPPPSTLRVGLLQSESMIQTNGEEIYLLTNKIQKMLLWKMLLLELTNARHKKKN